MNSIRIVASAGSGKTTEFIRLYKEYISNGVPQEAIQILMFSRAARADFKERLGVVAKQKKPKILISKAKINTIHSLASLIVKGVRGRGTEKES